MPLTRSAVARNKVHLSEETSSQQLENEELSPNGSMVENDKLPKTIKDAAKKDDDSHLSTKTAILLLILIFLGSAVALAAVYYSFPHLEP